MKIKIIHGRFEFALQRSIGYATLVETNDEGDVTGVIIHDDKLSYILQHCDEENIVIDNAQEILTDLVLRQGFGV